MPPAKFVSQTHSRFALRVAQCCTLLLDADWYEGPLKITEAYSINNPCSLRPGLGNQFSSVESTFNAFSFIKRKLLRKSNDFC